MRKLPPNNFSRAVVKRKGILKLFGESATADRRHIHQQTVLRIIQLQSGCQLGLLMEAPADDARWQHRRFRQPGLVTNDAAVGSRDHCFTTIGLTRGDDRKHALRWQALLDIEPRNDRSELIVESDAQETTARGCAPNRPRT